MSHTIEFLKDIRTVITTIHADFDPEVDGEQSYHEANKIMQEHGLTEMYFVVDFRERHISVNEIITMANVARSRRKNLPALDKAIVLDIIITSSRALEMAAKGMNTATFGNMAIQAFATREETIDFIRSELGLTDRR